MKEEWRPAILIDKNGNKKEYGDLYEVSNKSRFKYLNWKKTKSEKIVDFKKSNQKRKYYIVTLTKDHTETVCSLHRLVMSSFCPESDVYESIDHLDSNSHNNNLDNLKWCTNKDNCSNENTKRLRKEKRKKAA